MSLYAVIRTCRVCGGGDLCEVMALALWFSASAVIPALKVEYAIGSTHSSLLTSGVALGFVVGTLVSAVLGLADRLHPVRFFMISCWVAALMNAAILLFEPTSLFVIVLRFLTPESLNQFT